MSPQLVVVLLLPTVFFIFEKSNELIKLLDHNAHEMWRREQIAVWVEFAV